MDTTVAVAIAGIAGTLAAAVAAPWVAGRVQRAAVKEARIHAARLEAYVDLLQVTGQLVENFQTWSAIPLAEVEGPSPERVRSIDARIRVVGSDAVAEATKEFAALSSRFFADHFRARLRAERDRTSGVGDSNASSPGWSWGS
ncbi:MAG: hypothetical protein ACXWYT_02125 [Actinomycetota bacterium]